MLDPRAATLRSSTPSWAASSRAIAITSSAASADISPSEAPCPRASKARAAHPLAAARRAKSAWFSLREPAPWQITIPGQGGLGTGRAGSPRRSAGPPGSGSQRA